MKLRPNFISLWGAQCEIPKYTIGQKIWYMEHNKAYSAKLESIDCSVSKKGLHVCWLKIVKDDSGIAFSISASDAFLSKEELLKSL